MSSPDALATVTAALRQLIVDAVPAEISVSTMPPSTARGDNTGTQVNLFLYGTHISASFRNSPIPCGAPKDAQAHPPLPLVLKYLITAYGAADDDISGQQLMGTVMSVLHDHPLLGRADIEGITPDSRLQDQLERVRITPDALSLDDISKLWSSFQSAEYRLSVGYEVSLVLIESTRPQRSPLPVLRRGAEDRGPFVSVGGLPVLHGLSFPNKKISAELGDLITLVGKQLGNDNTIVRLRHAALDSPLELIPALPLSKHEMPLQLPTLIDDPQLGFNWPAGFYTLSLVTQVPGNPASSSNLISMQMAPQIESVSPANAAAGDVVLTIECLPQVKTGQEVILLFGDRLLTPDSVVTPLAPTAVSVLVFSITDALANSSPYIIRLRVDGVDSIPVDFSASTPQFDATQQVTIT